jgi:hypothetical protein
MSTQASFYPPALIRGRLAGISYPSDPHQALGYFQTALDAQETSPIPPVPGGALIVPHIDFRVNLSLYAHAYRALAGLEYFPETVFILGVGHRCPHEFSCCPLAYETVLGTVRHNEEAWQTLADASGLEIARSPSTFIGEHSLEYAVIWLQAVRDLHFPGQDFRIVPLLLGGLHEELALGRPPQEGSAFQCFTEGFRQAVSSIPRGRRLLLASIDGCHVGPRFDHGFEGEATAQRLVQSWEEELWSLCDSRTYPAFFDHLLGIRNFFHFDGVGALSLLLRAFPLKAVREAAELWHEDQDQSFVTFSAGRLDPL